MPWDSTSPSRRNQFRTRHRLGDRLPGTVLDCPMPGVAWVEVDGQTLFAKLETPVTVGHRLTFEVTALTPEIILKSLPDTTPDLKELIQKFLTARRRFEDFIISVNRESLDSPSGLDQSRKAFLHSLVTDGRRLRCYGAVLILQKRINQFLKSTHLGCLRYLPWLTPMVTECDLFFPSQNPNTRNVSSLVAGFQSSSEGYRRLHFYFRPPEATVRIITDSPSSRLSSLFTDQIIGTPGLHVRCLTVSRDTSNQPLNLLSWILSQANETKSFHATA